MMPLLTLVLLAMWEMALIGYTDVLASHSAREAARAWAVGEPCKPPAEKPLPKAWRHDMKAVQLSDGVKVTLTVPFVLPGMGSPLHISDHKRTVREQDGATGLTPVADNEKGTPCGD